MARGEVLRRAFNDEMVGLSNAAVAERLRPALSSAEETALDWEFADGRIVWEGAEDFYHHHVGLENLKTAQAFYEWLAPEVRGRLMASIDERTPIEPRFTTEFEPTHGTSREWVEMRAVRLARDDGRIERGVGVLRRVTVQKNTVNRLTHLATYDELTGQLNRSRLREELSLTIEKAKVLMPLWRYAVVTHLREAYRMGLLETDQTTAQLKDLLRRQHERWWSTHIQRFQGKEQFLRYAGRYARRPPIAQRRFQRIDRHEIQFETKDTRTKQMVMTKYTPADFVATLADHVPDCYRHNIRYFGLLAPRTKARTHDTVFALLGQKRLGKPWRLSWADSLRKYFGVDPLLDEQGDRMRWVGRLPATRH